MFSIPSCWNLRTNKYRETVLWVVLGRSPEKRALKYAPGATIVPMNPCDVSPLERTSPIFYGVLMTSTGSWDCTRCTVFVVEVCRHVPCEPSSSTVDAIPAYPHTSAKPGCLVSIFYRKQHLGQQKSTLRVLVWLSRCWCFHLHPCISYSPREDVGRSVPDEKMLHISSFTLQYWS